MTRAERSFDRLYRRHRRDVYRYALAVLRDAHDAEDVVQQTFLNAYRALQSGVAPEKPQHWLIKIAHNVCRQRFRDAKRRPTEVELHDDLAPAAAAPAGSVSAGDIQSALGHLTFNQRSALVARELEGRSYAEIAALLGMTVSAVETLIFRARRALREQLEGGLSCTEAEEALSRNLDGELPRAESGALRAHLRACPDCATLARSMRARRRVVRGILGAPLPWGRYLPGWFGAGGAKVAAAVCVGSVAVGAGVHELGTHRPPVARADVQAFVPHDPSYRAHPAVHAVLAAQHTHRRAQPKRPHAKLLRHATPTLAKPVARPSAPARPAVVSPATAHPAVLARISTPHPVVRRSVPPAPPPTPVAPAPDPRPQDDDNDDQDQNQNNEHGQHGHHGHHGHHD